MLCHKERPSLIVPPTYALHNDKRTLRSHSFGGALSAAGICSLRVHCEWRRAPYRRECFLNGPSAKLSLPFMDNKAFIVAERRHFLHARKQPARLFKDSRYVHVQVGT